MSDFVSGTPLLHQPAGSITTLNPKDLIVFKLSPDYLHESTMEVMGCDCGSGEAATVVQNLEFPETLVCVFTMIYKPR